MTAPPAPLVQSSGTPAAPRWARAKSVAARLAVADSAAAEMAFYLALTIVPLVGLALALASRWLPIDLGASFEEVLRGVLPAASHLDPDEILRWARDSASRGWLTIGFLVAAWTSFRFMSLCVRSLGSLLSTADAPPAPSWLPAARSLLLLFVWIFALVSTALSLLFAPEIERDLLRLPQLSGPSLTAFLALHAILNVATLFVAIYLTYRVVAGARAGPLRTVFASLLASLGWIGVGRGFSFAVPILWSQAQIYGTLGSVVLFLLWAYFMSWILLLGGFLLVPSRAKRAAAVTSPEPSAPESSTGP